MFISEYVHLAREQRPILVLPDFPRTHFGCGIPVERKVLDVYRTQFTVDSIIYMLLNELKNRVGP